MCGMPHTSSANLHVLKMCVEEEKNLLKTNEAGKKRGGKVDSAKRLWEVYTDQQKKKGRNGTISVS